MASFKIHTKGTPKYDVQADDFYISDGYFVFTKGKSELKVYAMSIDAVSRVERLED